MYVCNVYSVIVYVVKRNYYMYQLFCICDYVYVTMYIYACVDLRGSILQLNPKPRIRDGLFPHLGGREGITRGRSGREETVKRKMVHTIKGTDTEVIGKRQEKQIQREK